MVACLPFFNNPGTGADWSTVIFPLFQVGDVASGAWNNILEFRVAKWRTRDVRLYRTLKTEKQIPITDWLKAKPELFCF
jgi:hypothetical protein